MLWESEGTETDDSVQQFIQESKKLEQKLLPFDILGNLAHVKMLESQGYLTREEHAEIENALQQIYDEQPSVKQEDVHSFVEKKVTEITKAGKKLHTGRSRNDQVILDTRLLMEEASIELALEICELLETLKEFSEGKNRMIPGYTHQQQAMPSSIGLWASSFADALVDDLKILKSVYCILDQNPLGAAAGYGTSLDIDREMTSDLLRFDSVQQNPIYCVSSRGKHELMLVNALSQIMLDLQKMAEDLINFSGDQEIFDLAEKYCTGSSIMPQKSNPDTLEIIRANAEEIKSHQMAINGTVSKLPSGYNRDTQLTKKHLIESLEVSKNSIKMVTELIGDLEVSENFKIDKEVFAAFTANKKVENGMPFRDAYKKVKESEKYEKHQKIAEPVSQDYNQIEKFWQKQKKKWDEMEQNLLS